MNQFVETYYNHSIKSNINNFLHRFYTSHCLHNKNNKCNNSRKGNI